ncbi:MAG: haloacid dehalogenase type II [Burkholderiales bacterium]|nr:MAG: haloacid dehalogenase type II [Burkholderiales bacterium]
MEKAPRAVLFDAYGTLFDVYSVSMAAEQLFPGQGARLAQVWRDKQIEYSRLLTTCNHGAHYEPFWNVTEKALRYAIELVARPSDSMPADGQFNSKNGEKNEDLAVSQLMNQYRHLSAFPENREVLAALKSRGIVTGILSNGDPAMLDVAVKSAGLADVLDHVISVDTIRKYKTHPDAYALGSNATGLQPKQMLFVSSNGWDAVAATWFGYRTLWVNRAGLPAEQIGLPPTRVGTSLRDVFSFF